MTNSSVSPKHGHDFDKSCRFTITNKTAINKTTHAGCRCYYCVRRNGDTKNAKNHFQKITYRKIIQNEVIYSSLAY